MQVPRLPSFMKINKYSRFEINPRYYDERKERLKKIKHKYADEDVVKNTLVRDNLKQNWNRNRKLKTKSTSTTFRLFLIMVVLFALAYWILNLDLVKLFGK